MSYLFGDSTPSPFRINFIEFLRLAMGFSVHVLRVERRVLEEQTKRILLEEDSANDRKHLEQLLARVTKTIEDVSTGVQPRVVEYAEHIEGKAREVVEGGLHAFQQALTEDLAEIEQNIKLERRSALVALEKVLLQYDMPEARETIHIRLLDGGKYAASLEGVTPYGLSTTVDLVLPPESAFAHDARVDRFVDSLEIRAPETGGWLRKESRMVPQKLNRFHITEVTLGETSVIKLRSSAEAQATGFDIAIRTDESSVRIVKTGKDGDAEAFDPEPIDVPNLLRLRDKLEEAGKSLATKRRALIAAKLDQEPVEDSARMRALVEQLVQVIAPMVQEIAAHSFSSGELVLRRMMADDRREEVFVSKMELQAMLEGLSENDRQLFAPLELEQGVGAIPPIMAARLSQAPAKRMSHAPAPGAEEDRSPPSGVKRSNRPPPMRTGAGGI